MVARSPPPRSANALMRSVQDKIIERLNELKATSVSSCNAQIK